MPFCRNCGAKLDEDARFCRVCGTPVIQPAEISRAVASESGRRRVRRAGFPFILAALVIVVVLVGAAFIILFVPVEPVNFSQSNAAVARDVQSLNLVLGSDIGSVNVMVRDLPGNQLAATNVSATGWRGFFGTGNPLALSFKEDTNNSTLTWSVNVSRAGDWPIFNPLAIRCDLYIDPSVDLHVIVHSDTGSITLNGDRQATFGDLVLQTNTGNIVANLGNGTVITNRAVVETDTGSLRLNWDNPKVTGNVEVNLRSSTGSVDVAVAQAGQLQGNVTLDAESSTGSISFNMNIHDDVGARIDASSDVGSVNVQQQGFSGNSVPMQSDNYPAAGNFDVTLRSSTGSIGINANSSLVGTRS